jgi:hypothetical protein
MLRTGLSKLCIMGSIVLSLAAVVPASAQRAPIPDLSGGAGGWIHGRGTGFRPVPGSPAPMRQDPSVPFRGGSDYRIGDLTNPNLKPWVKEAMKKDNDEVLAGKIQFQSSAACLPSGLPLMFSYPNPLMILQMPDKVVFIKEAGQEVRHVYLNVPHSPNLKPSWYGESVGHYEGDTLVVDTIGFNAKTFVDVYRTPHTEKLHVTERWRTINDGKELEVIITVDDPDTYHAPWTTRIVDQRAEEPFIEIICAENNFNFGFFDLGMPVATTPDF